MAPGFLRSDASIDVAGETVMGDFAGCTYNKIQAAPPLKFALNLVHMLI